jgi:hypothetical protein
MNDEYFGKDKISEYKLPYPCKKSYKVTELRKIADKTNQYVTNVYYLDTLFGKNQIYSTYQDDDEYSPVYSCYHSECDYCKEHIQKVKENLIVGFKIYPVGIKPEKTYKQRKNEWLKYMFT